MFSRYKEQYEQLWKMIIRPPRVTYSASDLGASVQSLNNTQIRRLDFDLKNKNNLNLKCSYYQIIDSKTKQPNSQICVIYLHGNSGSRLEGLSVMPYVIEKGMNFCSFDFAGCGLSEGEYISLGIHEKDDVILLKSTLKSKFGINEVALWGRSMGAVTALHVGAKESDIFAMISDSPFLKLTRLASEIAKEHKHFSSFFSGIILSFAKKSIKKRANFSIEALDQSHVINQCKMPICFVTSKEDKFVKPYNVEELYNLYKGLKTLIYEKGDHNSQRSSEFYMEGTQFLRKNLMEKIFPELKGKKQDINEERKSNDDNRKSYDDIRNNKKLYTQNDIIKKFCCLNQKFDNGNNNNNYNFNNNNQGRTFANQGNY